MATELAVGYVSLVPSARGFGQGIAKELGSTQQIGEDVGAETGKRFSSGFGAKLKIAAAVGGAFAAVKVKDFVGDSIGAASDLEESASKVGQVFGDQAGVIDRFASNAATALGQSRQQALEAAGTFGNLFTSMGLSQDAAAGMSTEVVTLASDLASFNNLKPEEALEKLRAGLVGEVEPLRALGVNFNAAEVEAQAMKMGLQDANGEISESAKVQARMALIMAKTTNAQGDFARTSDGLANQQRIAAARFEDVKATIGTALLPIMTKLTNFVSTKLIPGFLKVASVLGKVGRFVADNQEYFIALGIGIMAALVPAFIAWATAAASAAAATLIAAAPVIAIGAAIAALAAGLVWAYQNVDIFRDAVDAVAGFLTGTVWPAIKKVASIFTDVLVPAIKKVIEFYWDFYRAVFDAVGRAASWVGEKVGDIVGFITGIPGRISSTVRVMFDGIKAGIQDARQWVSDRIGDIVGTISGMGGRISRVAGGMWDGIKNAFRSAVNWIIRAWNRLEFRIPGFDPPGPGPKFGGFTLGVPDIPTLHTGGIFQARGGEGLALLQSGERVLSLDQTRRYDAGMPTGGGRAPLIAGNYVVQATDTQDAFKRGAQELRRLQYLHGWG